MPMLQACRNDHGQVTLHAEVAAEQELRLRLTLELVKEHRNRRRGQLSVARMSTG